MITPLCLLAFLAFSSADDPLAITNLPDGIAISGGEHLRQITATWNIYVTLEPPPYPVQMANQLHGLQQQLNSLNTFDNIHDEIQALTIRKRRLLALIDTQHDRVKRGLIDIGGTILHGLFGVATNDQLKRFELALDAVSASADDIRHTQTALATIVNQTASYTHKLAVHQNQILHQQAAFKMAIQQLAEASSNQSRRIRRIELLTDLDRFIDVIEVAVKQHVAQVQLYHKQRAEMEAGRLTRDLLPQHHLEEILAQASASHHTISSVEWYFQYLFILPMWQATGKLVYQVEIPLIAPRPYLLYQITSLPVPLPNNSYTAIVHLKDAYALDTVSGNLFIPSHCLGHDPVVCGAGPEFDTSMEKCARGLLTNRQDFFKECTATVTPTTGHSVISTLDTNQYALITQGETLAVRCPGTPEHHIQLDRGTYNLTCLSSCSLAGRGWVATCIKRVYVNHVITDNAALVVAHFNLTARGLLQSEMVQPNIPDLDPLRLPSSFDIDVMSLINPKPLSRSVFPPWRPSLLSIINITLILTFWAFLAAVYLSCRRRRSKPNYDSPGPQSEALPITASESPGITTYHVAEEQVAPSSRIWPTIALSDCFSGQGQQPVIVPTTEKAPAPV
jgi:hypothetical protein